MLEQGGVTSRGGAELPLETYRSDVAEVTAPIEPSIGFTDLLSVIRMHRKEHLEILTESFDAGRNFLEGPSQSFAADLEKESDVSCCLHIDLPSCSCFVCTGELSTESKDVQEVLFALVASEVVGL
jgi:hypothetical protein